MTAVGNTFIVAGADVVVGDLLDHGNNHGLFATNCITSSTTAGR
jgi:hypothetical protein